jgi:hypothetical protein
VGTQEPSFPGARARRSGDGFGFRSVGRGVSYWSVVGRRRRGSSLHGHQRSAGSASARSRLGQCRARGGPDPGIIQRRGVPRPECRNPRGDGGRLAGGGGEGVLCREWCGRWKSFPVSGTTTHSPTAGSSHGAPDNVGPAEAPIAAESLAGTSSQASPSASVLLRLLTYTTLIQSKQEKHTIPTYTGVPSGSSC